jgi:hypothetical protein
VGKGEDAKRDEQEDEVDKENLVANVQCVSVEKEVVGVDVAVTDSVTVDEEGEQDVAEEGGVVEEKRWR